MRPIYEVWKVKSLVFSCGIPVLLVCLSFERIAARHAEDLVMTQLLADVDSIAPGKPFTLGVKFKIAPDWHIYWINPGDTGLPTKVTFDLPPGFTASDLQFPVPRRIELPGNLVSFGYEDEVMLLATVTPPGDLAVGSDVTIRGKASWLVCKENCLRGDQNIQMTLKTDAKPQAANQAEFDKMAGAVAAGEW